MTAPRKKAVFSNYRQVSIKVQLLSMLSLLAVFICVITLLLYGLIMRTERNNSYKEISSYVDEINRNIALRCENYNQLLRMITFDDFVQDFVTSSPDPMDLWLDHTVRLDDFLQNIVNLHPDILDAVVMTQNGEIYGLLKNYREENSGVRRNLDINDICHYSEVIQLNTLNSPKSGIVISSRIYSISPSNYLKNIGAAALIIRSESVGLSEAAKRSTYPVELFVLDANGKIFSSESQSVRDEDVELLFHDIQEDAPLSIDGVRYMAYCRKIDIMNGTLLALVSEQDLLSSARATQYLIVPLLLCFIIIVFLICWYIQKGITTPIRTLSTIMHQNSEIRQEDGTLDQLAQHIRLDGCLEVREIAYEYNRMMRTIQKLTQTIIHKDKHILQVELEKKQAELIFLQNQTNPHFLCNAFDSIKGLAARHNDQEIRSAANDLSVFFRYSLLPGDTVTLEEELDAVSHYVRIQQLRFGNRFSVSWDIQDNCKSVMLPRMILQPLVENAIIHGIESSECPCSLTVSCVSDDDKLTIQVSDNGSGIHPEKLAHLRSSLNASIAESRKLAETYRIGIGLLNVNNRIRLHYGSSYGLQIDSIPNEGTTVTIQMPTDRNKSTEQER